MMTARSLNPQFLRPSVSRRGLARPLLLVVLVMGAAGAAAWGWSVWGRSSSAGDEIQQSSDWYRVTRRSFDLVVLANGELEAGSQAEIKCQIEGNTTIVEILPEGEQVRKGDVIVRLADDQIKEKVEQERLSTEQARTDKVAAEQELAITENEAANDIKAAEVKLELAKLDLEKWQRGDDPKKQRELLLARQKADRNLTRAKDDLAASEQLFKEDFISQSELEDDRLALIEAEAALETAKLDIEVYEHYTRPKEHKKAESDVEQATAELDRKQRSNESRLAQARAKLAGRISQLRIREDRLVKLEQQLEQATIRAPQDGLVVYGTSVGPSWRRRDPIVAGKQVRFNETLVVLPDTSKMVAKLKIHEALVSQIKVGQPATVTIDAKGGRPLEGKVTELGVMAEDAGWINPDLREYPVKVTLPDSAVGELKPAMRCTARIVTGRVENALAVPLQAVVTEGRRRFVHVPAGGDHVRRRQVTIGRANEAWVEITAGVSEDDVVLVRKPAPGELIQDKTQTPDKSSGDNGNGDHGGNPPVPQPPQTKESPAAASPAGAPSSPAPQPSGDRPRRERPRNQS